MQVIDHNKRYPRGYIIISNNFITEVEILSREREFCTLKVVNENRGMRIRSNRLFASAAEAEKFRDNVREMQRRYLY